MRIAYLTAGAAGMYCGSCLHDNALVRALQKQGHDALLLPVYTPIRTDQEDVSSNLLFLGGLNIYLQQMSPVFRRLPKWADAFLNRPWLVRWAASRSSGRQPKSLGALTVSMLKGIEGHQRKEVERLCEWLEGFAPHAVVFSNLLIAGCATTLRSRIGCPLTVVLQGDDIFFDGLPEPWRGQAMEELRRLAQHVDLFFVHSKDYGQRMSQVLEFDPGRLAVLPLGIDPTDLLEVERDGQAAPDPTVGYLARLAPEKGLHLLVDAFILLRESIPAARLEIAGWLGEENRRYWREQQKRLERAGLADAYRYHGSVDRGEKRRFLSRIDVLSVPTIYREPKGLFVLEGLAAGVPYALPAHGAFPELHARLGGGLLFPPADAQAAADAIHRLLADRSLADQLRAAGRRAVLEKATIECEAAEFMAHLNRIGCDSPKPSA